ncbi:hypothetical protein JYB87_15705 [Shewanella avicenniae]|uniref:Outer membrane protein beta-barrel domain-containing protein n=1 Tax=Shewanella avicenniae TaxID=2814294 RepID=A0ABX7QNV3_9GAMM|nr:hypothetical protein [Shewanella avicenniae]QSX33152.1 hypothetical protein JYB87_15705 [Shewanella avicenniae]
MKFISAAAAVVVAASTLPAVAGETHFSLTGGLPFMVIPEVSYHPNDQQRWFANYKVGLDDGVSAGFEQAVDDNNRHALGIVAGALGVRNGHKEWCGSDSESGSVGYTMGCAIGTALAEPFDNHTVNGLGVSYSYNRHGLSERGLRVRLEWGYGRISGADFDKEGFTGGFAVGYQF